MTLRTRHETTAIDPTLGIVDFGAVLNSLPACVMVADRNLLIRFRNRAAHALLHPGLTLNEAFVKVKFLGRFDGLAQEVTRVATSGEPRTIECVVPQGSEARPALLIGSLTRVNEPNAEGPLVLVSLDRRVALCDLQDPIDIHERSRRDDLPLRGAVGSEHDHTVKRAVVVGAERAENVMRWVGESDE